MARKTFEELVPKRETPTYPDNAEGWKLEDVWMNEQSAHLERVSNADIAFLTKLSRLLRRKFNITLVDYTESPSSWMNIGVEPFTVGERNEIPEIVEMEFNPIFLRNEVKNVSSEEEE